MVRAVPLVTAFGEVHNNALTPRGGHAAGRKDGIDQVRQHLHSRATRVLEKLRRDPITTRCFVDFEAPHAATHFIERKVIPQPVASCPGRAHSAASAACARATDALSSCRVVGSRALAMAAVNAASAAAYNSSVVHDAPVSGWRNEGIPWLRGAAARRSSDLCMT